MAKTRADLAPELQEIITAVEELTPEELAEVKADVARMENRRAREMAELIVLCVETERAGKATASEPEADDLSPAAIMSGDGPDARRFPWENDEVAWGDRDDIIHYNGSTMLEVVVEKLTFERCGIRRAIRDIQAGREPKSAVEDLWRRVLTLACGIAVDAAPYIAANRETLALPAWEWPGLRKFYAGLVETVRDRERYWRVEAWEIWEREAREREAQTDPPPAA